MLLEKCYKAVCNNKYCRKMLNSIVTHNVCNKKVIGDKMPITTKSFAEDAKTNKNKRSNQNEQHEKHARCISTASSSEAADNVSTCDLQSSH
jgi:hypothetical protein